MPILDIISASLYKSGKYDIMGAAKRKQMNKKWKRPIIDITQAISDEIWVL